jgi:hypothetical protein
LFLKFRATSLALHFLLFVLIIVWSLRLHCRQEADGCLNALPSGSVK